MSNEKAIKPAPGMLMLLLNLALFFGAAYGVYLISKNEANPGMYIAGDVVLWIAASLMSGGFTG